MTWTPDPRVENALGTFGIITSVALFVAPIKTFKRIVSNKSTEEFSPFPYASTLLNCGIWVFYALPTITPNRFSPLLTNLIGVAFQAIYLAIFISCASGPARVNAFKMLSTVAAFLAVFVVAVLAFVEPPNRSSLVGMVAMFFTVIMYGSPLTVVGVVLRTWSVEYMPLLLSLNGFACSSTWSLYGLYVEDINIILPNILGSTLGLVQLILYCIVRFARSSLPNTKRDTYEFVPTDEPSTSAHFTDDSIVYLERGGKRKSPTVTSL